MTPSFDHLPGPRIVCGPGSIRRLGEAARPLGARRILIVTDPGVKAAGHLEVVRETLAASQLETVVFDEVIPNPTTRCVEHCRDLAKAERIDGILGLGGGSSLDTAKGCNFLLTNGGRMQDYWGSGKATQPMLPWIAVPTTAGTGSECQSYALITDEQTHRKMACGDPKAIAKAVILDPLLTFSQPARVTACAGLDALAHAVETAVTRKRTAISLLYSREAFRLAMDALPKVIERPGELEARAAMQLAAAWAGLAIEHSMLGAAHAAANPLTAHFGVIHGEAVGMMLPWVVRFNAADPDARAAYADLAWAGRMVPAGISPGAASAVLAEKIEDLLQAIRLPRRLSERGVAPESLTRLAADAAREWTGNFNPRPVGPTEFEQLYRSALEGRPAGE